MNIMSKRRDATICMVIRNMRRLLERDISTNSQQLVGKNNNQHLQELHESSEKYLLVALKKT